MDFGTALHRLKGGAKISNIDLAAEKAHLYLVPASSFVVNRAPLADQYAGQTVSYRAHVDKIAETTPGFLEASVYQFTQADILRTDWLEL